MNVLEEMNKKKPVTALITVFKDICKTKLRWPAQPPHKRWWRIYSHYNTNHLKKVLCFFSCVFILKSLCSFYTIDSLYSRGEQKITPESAPFCFFLWFLFCRRFVFFRGFPCVFSASPQCFGNGKKYISSSKPHSVWLKNFSKVPSVEKWWEQMSWWHLGSSRRDVLCAVRPSRRMRVEVLYRIYIIAFQRTKGKLVFLRS